MPPNTSARPAQWLSIERAITLGALGALVILLGGALSAGSATHEEKLTRAFNAHIAAGPAPDFEVVDAKGQTFKLSDFRGKVVFLNFWATWCPPCRTEWPDLEKLAVEMEGQPFVMLAVSQDASWDEINTFLAGRRSGLTIGLDPKGTIASHWGTSKLPETYIIDKSGHLRLRFVNIQPWAEKDIVFYLKWLSSQRG